MSRQNNQTITEDEYIRLCEPYLNLASRYYRYPHYTYKEDQFYLKCFSKSYYGVSGENLQTLSLFSNMRYKDIRSKEYLTTIDISHTFYTSELIIIEEKKVCVHVELGIVFFYLLVTKLKSGICEFVTLVKDLIKKNRDMVDHNDVFKMHSKFYESNQYRFENVKNYDLVLRLLSKTNSGLIIMVENGTIEIHTKRIDDILKESAKYDFSMLEI